MSAPWLDSVTPVGPPTSARPTVRELLYAAAVTGGWSSVLSILIYLVGRLFGVSFEISPRPGEPLMAVPWFVVLLLPLAAAVVGALVASLARGWRHAGRIVFWAGSLIAAASCAAPLLQPAQVPWSTRILLLLMHVITWFLVVPQLARIVGDSEPGHTVERPD